MVEFASKRVKFDIQQKNVLFFIQFRMILSKSNFVYFMQANAFLPEFTLTGCKSLLFFKLNQPNFFLAIVKYLQNRFFSTHFHFSKNNTLITQNIAQKFYKEKQLTVDLSQL